MPYPSKNHYSKSSEYDHIKSCKVIKKAKKNKHTESVFLVVFYKVAKPFPNYTISWLLQQPSCKA